MLGRQGERRVYEMSIDLSRFPLAENLRGETPSETQELQNSFAEAKNYIQSFKWCEGIRESYFGGGVGGIVGLFLFNILPSEPEVDEWVWVVVGDLPPAYLLGRDSPTASEALEDHISHRKNDVF
jgi:hypothetical protein